MLPLARLPMDFILVLNAGSSSVKFQLFGTDGTRDLEGLVKGQVDGIGSHPRLRAAAAGRRPIDEVLARSLSTVSRQTSKWQQSGFVKRITSSRLPWAVAWCTAARNTAGRWSTRTCSLISKALSLWRRFTSQTLLRRSIRFVLGAQVPQIACFETAFHREHGSVVNHFVIPERFYEEGVQRYAEHGTDMPEVQDWRWQNTG